MRHLLTFTVIALGATLPLSARIGESRDALIARMGKPKEENEKTGKAVWQLGENKEFTFEVKFDEGKKSEFERVDINAAAEPSKVRDAALNFITAQIEYAKMPENSWKNFETGDEITFGGRRLTLSPTQNAHLVMSDEKILLFYEKGTATVSPYLWAATEKAFRRDDVARAPKDKDGAATPPSSPNANGAPSF